MIADCGVPRFVKGINDDTQGAAFCPERVPTLFGLTTTASWNMFPSRFPAATAQLPGTPLPIWRVGGRIPGALAGFCTTIRLFDVLLPHVPTSRSIQLSPSKSP